MCVVAIQFPVNLFLPDVKPIHLFWRGAAMTSIRQTPFRIGHVLHFLPFIICNAVGAAATQENRLIYEALHFRLVQIVTGLVPAKREPPPP